MARFGSVDVPTWWNSIISNTKGESFCVGYSEYDGGGNSVNIVSKFQNMYTSLNISDDVEPVDLIERFLQQVWLVSGVMVSI